MTHDFSCVTKHKPFGWRRDHRLLFFVSGKSISDSHSWHVPDSPSPAKHRYKQMEEDRSEPPIPSDASTPYKQPYVSDALEHPENITLVAEVKFVKDFGANCIAYLQHLRSGVFHGDRISVEGLRV